MMDMFTQTIKKASLISVMLLSFAGALCAQKGEFLGELQGRNHRQKGHAYQGMDVWGRYVFSCQNQGIGTVYLLNGDGFEKVGQFNLGSFNPANHSNVVSFGVGKVEESDPLPVVYVSQCYKKTYKGLKDVCFVERIAPDFQSSELLQTILYDDRNRDFGYALQWVVDRKNGFLYGYGNTISNSDPSNRHRVIKFRLPELSEGAFVTLRPEDALENYTIEEVSGYSFNPIGQGLDIRYGKLYMPTGFGNEKHPSELYVWDLRHRKMKKYNLSACTTGELEDVAVLGRNLLLFQSQDGLFKVRVR